MLSGHTISFSPPLFVLNLLPVDAEFRIIGKKYAVAASKQIQITSVSNFSLFGFIVLLSLFPSSLLRRISHLVHV